MCVCQYAAVVARRAIRGPKVALVSRRGGEGGLPAAPDLRGGAVAEVSGDDGGVGDHGARRALGDDFTLMGHDSALGEGEDDLHKMLDDDDGDAAGVNVAHELARRDLMAQDTSFPAMPTCRLTRRPLSPSPFLPTL